ncbi:transposase [Streptomyces sp. NPDC057199]|uniref:transposase n=1 Tax=Streptomyces sp. NPDC057199 TaxID=3346047 RepID=UPI003632D8B2
MCTARINAPWTNSRWARASRPAARLCRRLRLAAGWTRLLRLLTAPAVPDRARCVPGVDEFTFQKGRTYGTVLVDVEAGRVVNVLPDRTSETFTAWLKEHFPAWRSSVGNGPSPTPRRPGKPPPMLSRSLIAGTCYRTCPPRWGRPATSIVAACASAPRRSR